eukprot:GCRY01004136.1.p1 GENE.GCRY01004136.1~~GCRY01004136.1.p1  ORF type:complete len:254 (+),score=57.93 GCRY01004136.1:157-918(+)
MTETVNSSSQEGSKMGRFNEDGTPRENAKIRAKKKAAEQEALRLKKLEDASWEEKDVKVKKVLNRQKHRENKLEETFQKKIEAKAEKNALLEKEEEELQKEIHKKAKVPPTQKTTRFQIEMRKKKEAEAAKKAEFLRTLKSSAKPQKKSKKAATDEDQEDNDADLERNLNRERGLDHEEVDAHGLDKALDQLGVSSPSTARKSAKVLYREFEERNLPIFREEFKFMRLQQIKHKIWEAWLESPENPGYQGKGK